MYINKAAILVIILLLFFNTCMIFAGEVDSLKVRLESETGEEKIEILNRLAGNYWELPPNERIAFAEQMLELSEKLQDQRSKADAYNHLGVAYNQLDETQKSMDYFLKALDIAEQTNDKDRIAKSFLNLGQANFYLDNFDKAQEYFQKVLEIRKKIGDKQDISMALNLLGTVMAKTNRYDEALDYFSQSLTIRKEINDKMGISQIYNNIANVYFDLGEMDNVLEYRLKSLRIVRELDNKWEMAITTYNVAEYYLENNEPDKAYPYLLESQELAEKLNNQGLIRDNTQFFSWYYELKKDYPKSIKYLKDYAKLTKKQFSETLSEKIAEMQAKYDVETKDKEIALLQKNNQIHQLNLSKQKLVIFFSISFLILFIVIGLIIFIKDKNIEKKLERAVSERTRELKNEIDERVQTELKLLQANDELTKLQLRLEQKVGDAIKQIRQQDHMIIRQSRQVAMGELMNNVAHHWRQPLAAVGVIVQDIQDAFHADELNEKYLEESVNEAMKQLQQMSKTITDISELFITTKVERSFNVKEEIEKMIQILSQNFKANDINTYLDCEEGCTILGYPHEFAQVVFNILTNAKEIIVQRECKERSIFLKISNENKRCRIIIEDTAGGIDDELIDKIFEPYFSTKENLIGTGLGLYMSKMIIEKNMKGSLSVQNTEKGAAFTIEITTN